LQNDLINLISVSKKLNIMILAVFSIAYSIIAIADEINVSVQSPSFFQKEATVTVKNNRKFTQVVKIDLSNNSNRSEVIGSSILTIPGDSSISVKVLPFENKSFSHDIYFAYVRGVGDFTKEVDRNGYQLPFDENFETTVCQFPHGDSPAIDFCAPIGTKVYAAKEGTVIWTVDQFGDGGNDINFFDKANLVEILQTDGSRALYTHLQKNTIIVKEGQLVKRGDLIGQVGLSGQTSGPHLHFHVAKLSKDFKDEMIYPIFVNSQNIVLELKNGNKMTRESSVSLIDLPSKTNPDSVISSVPIKVINEIAPVSCATNNAVDDKTKAIDCFSKNQFEKAITFFTKHVKLNPNDSLSLARLAISYTRINKHEEAVKAYKDAIAKNWISYDFASLYARSLFAIGQKEEAIKWNKRSLVLAPNCNDCRRDLALQLKDYGRKKEALQLLKDYDDKLKSQGKSPIFQGMIMLIEDEINLSK
jgi:tetratricopeptide (TPR) repeat protein